MYSHTNCDNRCYLCPSLYWASSWQTGIKWAGFLFAKTASGGWLAIKQKHLLVCLSHSSTQKRCKSYTVSVVHWTKIWYFTHQHHTYNLIPVWLSICAVLVDLKNGAVYALHDWKEKKVRHEKVFNFFSRLSFCQTFVFHKKHEASACFKRWFKR